jgi:hypothetical protein
VLFRFRQVRVGSKATNQAIRATSAFRPLATIKQTSLEVQFGPLGDIDKLDAQTKKPPEGGFLNIVSE